MRKILDGRAASAGVARGKVKIVKDEKDFHSFKNGEILVTEMTDPSMVMLMGKASAIITNFGGMSCHAAIVAREMGIPCVVGTEKATVILKNGLKVVVNGNNGEVFLIEDE